MRTSITDFNRAPTSGGQYHWVSEFAPPSCQCILSYFTGWVCVLGWHTGIAGCSYTVANMMVGIIAINYPDSYTYQPWHVTLLVIAVAVVALFFNTFLAQKLPLIEGIILIIHCFGFFAILIPLWVLSPTTPASDVFGSIEDRGGWGNNGLACLVGLTGPMMALIGPDSAVHMCKSPAVPMYRGEHTYSSSRGNQGCVSRPAYGHALDVDPQRFDWSRYDHHVRLLHR